MKNRMAIRILKEIAQQHNNPAEQRAFEAAIAALEYCEKNKLTYYIKEKYFGKIDK